MTDDYVPQLSKPDSEWREQLSNMEYAVLRKAATEPPFTGEYTDTEDEGTYVCKACGSELFTSTEKFHSNCGWPSFYAPAAEGRVRYLKDTSIPGRPRIEVRCTNCDSHLGHVFEGEGFATPTDKRYCINSIALKLEKA